MNTARGTLIFAFATKGTGTNEELRLRELLAGHVVEWLPYDKRAKWRSGWSLIKTLFRHRPDLVVMEGTGLGGGIACLLSRWLAGIRYVFSSGDAVGPFIGAIHPLAGPFFAVYERLLCRWCEGFIGWTPYLVGRALTFRAPRAVTAAGWAPVSTSTDRAAARTRVRMKLGIADDVIVFGIIGALVWNRRFNYCYGLELVKAIKQLPADAKVAVVIVGDGTGMEHLRSVAGALVGKQIFLPGGVAADLAAEYWAAFDVASLPQSVDGVGSFRYTTKLSEILAAGLPVVTGQIPLAYDLDTGWLWRLPGSTPWSDEYIASLHRLMAGIDRRQIELKAQAVPDRPPEFDRAAQVRRVGVFISELIATAERRSGIRVGGVALVDQDIATESQTLEEKSKEVVFD